MIRRGSLLLIDTNILLSATDASRNEHEICRKLLRESNGFGIHLCVCGQILREYLVVCTRPVEVNGLGMSIDSALKNVSWFRRICVFLEETEAVFDVLANSAPTWQGSGKRNHDLNLVALLLVHRVGTLITLNGADFPSNKDISVLTPDAVVTALEDSSTT
jgi:predicted nucleic acid-binding protein